MIEKILERLEEAKFPITDLKDGVKVNGIQATDDAVLYAKAIEIVQEVAKEYGKDTNVRSNADHIRAMSDVELADYLETLTMICSTCIYQNEDCAPISNEKCRDGILTWLKSEVKE